MAKKTKDQLIDAMLTELGETVANYAKYKKDGKYNFSVNLAWTLEKDQFNSGKSYYNLDKVLIALLYAHNKLDDFAFIDKYRTIINFPLMITELDHKLSESFIRRYFNKFLSKRDIIKYQEVSEDFLHEYRDKFSYNDWEVISRIPTLSEDFIDQHFMYIHWGWLIWEVPLTDKLIYKYYQLIDLRRLFGMVSRLTDAKTIKNISDECRQWCEEMIKNYYPANMRSYMMWTQEN